MTRILAAALLAIVAMAVAGVPAAAKTCRPNIVFDASPSDTYLSGSPVRSVSGHGHVLTGVVLSRTTCRPIVHAKLEFFHAGPDGNYSDGMPSWAGRATVFTKAHGGFRFESRYPSNSAGVRPHIHFRISAPGFKAAAATYFTRADRPSAQLVLVLTPRR
jgi:protocatechuate 3,4-dioxygenase beta subunit